MSHARALDKLRDAYPREHFGTTTQRVYADDLIDLDEQAVLDAVTYLVRTEPRRPTVARIRLHVANESLALPEPAEAWELATKRNGKRMPSLVRASVDAMGGPWNMTHSENPTALRAQFLRDYESRRDKAVREFAAGREHGYLLTHRAPAQIEERTGKYIDAEREQADAARRLAQTVPSANEITTLASVRLEAVPETTRIRPRPIISRLAGTWNGGRSDRPPTEEEIHDAIRILEAGPEPGEDPLYREAEWVFHLAAQ